MMILSSALMAQKPAKIGTVKYLEEKRSFKNIKLGAEVSTIAADVQETRDTSLGVMSGVKFYEVVNSETLKVGD